MSNNIVIVGADPCGLSIEPHPRARGVGHRIFGKPMWDWQQKMPPSERIPPPVAPRLMLGRP